MPTYNIYPYSNAQQDVEPVATVTLSDDGTNIVSVKSSDREAQAEIARMLDEYVERGLTPEYAIVRIAGSYGDVAEVHENGSIGE